MEKIKKCPTCRKIKKSQEFPKRGCNGLGWECTLCKRKRIQQDRIKHPEKFKQRDIAYGKKRPRLKWANSSLQKHKDKWIVLISPKELEEFALTKNQCEICGCDLNWGIYTKNGKMQPNSPTLDRINGENFIKLDNIAILCHKCNAAKSSMTMQEFLDFCRMVVLRHGDRFPQAG